MNTEQKNYTWPIIITIAIVIIVGASAYYLGTKKNNASITYVPTNDTTQATTTGPSGSVPQTPVTPEEVKSWKTYTYAGIVFKYPLDWKAEAGFYYNTAGSGGQDSVIFSPASVDIKSGTNQRIDVGGHQLSCSDLQPPQYQCKTVNQIPVYTQSTDPEILRVFNAIIANAVNNDEIGWKTYIGAALGYQINYPKTLTLAVSGDYPPVPGSSVKGVIFDFPKTYYQAGTISSAEIGIVATKASCSQMADGNAWQGEVKTITTGGQVFDLRTLTDPGAGQIYISKEYSITRNNLCYRIGLLIHETNPGIVYNDRSSIDAATKLNTQLEANIETIQDQMVATFLFTK